MAESPVTSLTEVAGSHLTSHSKAVVEDSRCRTALWDCCTQCVMFIYCSFTY